LNSSAGNALLQINEYAGYVGTKFTPPVPHSFNQGGRKFTLVGEVPTITLQKYNNQVSVFYEEDNAGANAQPANTSDNEDGNGGGGDKNGNGGSNSNSGGKRSGSGNGSGGNGGNGGDDRRQPGANMDDHNSPYGIYEYLNALDHVAYIQGYPDNTVLPDSNLTRAEAAMMLWRLLKPEYKVAADASPFSDVGDKQWHAQAIKALAKKGVLKGYPDGTFRPNQAITRAEFTAILSRFDTLEAGGADNPFTDVRDKHWARDYIISTYTKGWIRGYPGGEFKPDTNISRAEATSAINRMLGRLLNKSDVPASIINRFIDLPTSYWAFADLMEASTDHEYNFTENGNEVWTNW
jgi:hypothetical protein